MFKLAYPVLLNLFVTSASGEHQLSLLSQQKAVIYRIVGKQEVMTRSDLLESPVHRPSSAQNRWQALMICADFLAGANLENGNHDVLLTSLRRFFAFLSAAHQQQFLRDIRRSA
jgi:hypothetical protein